MTNHLKLADSYLRLSDEEKKYGNESESITNQREIIRDYCKKQGIIIVSEFVDDGYSGGNFERPAFRQCSITWRQEKRTRSLPKTCPVWAVI